MRDNERVQHLSRPLRTDLGGSQFSTLNSAGINVREGPEKYNNKGQLFTAATQHMTPLVVKYKNLVTK
jgi:hypothetical protein